MAAALVTIRRYPSVIDAQLAQVLLEANGIASFLPDEQIASIDPLLVGAIGHVRLQVRRDQLEHACDVLDAPVRDDDDDDDLEEGPRCPKCWSAYCGPRWSSGQLFVGMLGLGIPLSYMAKRMRCDRCEHVWLEPLAARVDPKAKLPYRAAPPRPLRDGRPVFRLRRTSAGAGLVVGLSAGMLLAVSLGASEVVPVVLVLSPVAGVLLGHGMKRDVCSNPKCRAPLGREDSECVVCRGTVQGAIARAAEHYAAKAAWHREHVSGASSVPVDRR